MEIDLHGYGPNDLDCLYGNAGKLADFVREAWEKGARVLTLIHGHGRNRGKSPGFVNTNTGFFGLCIRAALRSDKGLRQWIYHTTADCSDAGCTSVRLRPKYVCGCCDSRKFFQIGANNWHCENCQFSITAYAGFCGSIEHSEALEALQAALTIA